MKIYTEVCIACEACIPYCLMEAISMKDNVAVID
jgi:NAD-dependent dihydropyrimidine dehydrogenase PreA subunit